MKFKITQTIIALLALTNSAHAGSWHKGQFQGAFGARDYKVYVPEITKNAKLPVVVMIHGCEQNPDDFAKGTRITKFADKEGFIVLLPEQSLAYNPFKCWNWSLPQNNTRFGEPKVIVDMLDKVIDKYNGDSEKVYAAGMSSGASMVSILGNCFPERFRALGSHDGTQYFATSTGADFATVVLNGATVPPSVAAYVGHKCSSMVSDRPSKMPIIIFHGMKSPLMSPVHAFQIEDEIKDFNDYLDNGIRDNSYFKDKDVKNVKETSTYGYNLFTTTNQENDVLIERYMVDKLGHDWSGGLGGMKYFDPKGPDATNLIVKFFKKYGL